MISSDYTSTTLRRMRRWVSRIDFMSSLNFRRPSLLRIVLDLSSKAYSVATVLTLPFALGLAPFFDSSAILSPNVSYLGALMSSL